jgi:hypothetical protein
MAGEGKSNRETVRLNLDPPSSKRDFWAGRGGEERIVEKDAVQSAGSGKRARVERR